MFNNSTGSGRNARFDRFFDVLARNEKLCTEMEQELYEAARKKGSDPQNWLKWIRYYLYEKYREHGKMYLLEKNENTKVKFISSGKNNDDGTAFAELLIENLIQIHKIAEEDDGEVEIYLKEHAPGMHAGMISGKNLHLLRILCYDSGM